MCKVWFKFLTDIYSIYLCQCIGVISPKVVHMVFWSGFVLNQNKKMFSKQIREDPLMPTPENKLGLNPTKWSIIDATVLPTLCHEDEVVQCLIVSLKLESASPLNRGTYILVMSFPISDICSSIIVSFFSGIW